MMFPCLPFTVFPCLPRLVQIPCASLANRRRGPGRRGLPAWPSQEECPGSLTVLNNHHGCGRRYPTTLKQLPGWCRVILRHVVLPRISKLQLCCRSLLSTPKSCEAGPSCATPSANASTDVFSMALGRHPSQWPDGKGCSMGRRDVPGFP
jgi:hypothetical protein